MTQARMLLLEFVKERIMKCSEEEILRRLKILNITPPTENLNSEICKNCGTSMTSNGSCYKCDNCGWTSGCS